MFNQQETELNLNRIFSISVFKGALSGLRQFWQQFLKNPLKNDEKLFLFYLKSFFHSQDI